MGDAGLPSPPPDTTLGHWLEVALWPGISSDTDATNRLLRDARTREARLQTPTRFRAAAGFTHLSMRVVTATHDSPDRVLHASSRRGSPVPIVVGSGEVDLACGACGFIVCRAIGAPAAFAGLLFSCPACSEIVVLDEDDAAVEAAPAESGNGL